MNKMVAFVFIAVGIVSTGAGVLLLYKETVHKKKPVKGKHDEVVMPRAIGRNTPLLTEINKEIAKEPLVRKEPVNSNTSIEHKVGARDLSMENRSQKSSAGV